jgi:DNA-binding NarL/FixJ family response regulator
MHLFARAGDESLARQFGLSSKHAPPAQPESLTPRELDVLEELKRGASNRQIAERLFISESTVKVHLRHIYEKLGVRTRTELLAKTARRP